MPAIHIKEDQQTSDQRLVKGTFRCFDPMGGGARVPYRRYKGEQIENYDLIDGQIYEIPLGLARHLRDNCYEVEHGYVLNNKGEVVPDKNFKKTKRMTFEPLVFDLDGHFLT